MKSALALCPVSLPLVTHLTTTAADDLTAVEIMDDGSTVTICQVSEQGVVNTVVLSLAMVAQLQPLLDRIIS